MGSVEYPEARGKRREGKESERIEKEGLTHRKDFILIDTWRSESQLYIHTLQRIGGITRSFAGLNELWPGIGEYEVLDASLGGVED